MIWLEKPSIYQTSERGLILRERGIVVDLFAGGGGASEGIRQAIGRDPDVAVNHDRVAIAMHEANHPDTWHLRQDILEVPPRWASRRRPVGLLWASPDCKHFSKAKGKAPKRSREIRSLAWVVEKWARDVRPLVIVLENVEEFKSWGPLDKHGKVIKSQAGTTFRAFVRRIRRLGYDVEWRELRACDYGAPTIRKRLFMVMRRDDLPIIWPEPTHGPGLTPYRTAAEIIDWSIPCPSIFERRKPLVENTLRRIAEGIRRYVIEAAEPFIVTCNHGGEKFRGQGIHEPFRTVTASRDAHGIVVPHISRQFGTGIGSPVDHPIGTTTSGGMGKSALVSAFLAKHFGGVVGHQVDRPAGTITTKDHHSIVTSNLVKLRGTCRDGQAVTDPMPTVTAGGNHIGEVRSFLLKYYGSGSRWSGCDEPVHTLTARHRMGLVTVMVGGEPYVITDIGMRMLSPRELFRAQGFDDSYQIDIQVNDRRITKADQVRCCGNSVCPPLARAIVEANYAQIQANPREAAAI